NGDTGATVGTVDVTNTAHTTPALHDALPIFTGTANYNDITAHQVITDTINKADATFTVTPYNVTYNGLSHTASVSTITGVNGERAEEDTSELQSHRDHIYRLTHDTKNWTFTE